MLKKHPWKLVLSSVLILVPALVGMVLWDELPEQVVSHWGLSGVADGFTARAVAVFGVPLGLLALHWVCLLITARDPGNRNQSKNVFDMVFWICPVISFLSSAVMQGTVLEHDFESGVFMPVLIGLAFIIIGNQLPKCRRNRTIGIKVKWALEDDENWNATHRMGGRLWVAGGFFLLACGFLPDAVIAYVTVAALAVIAIVPVVYSYCYYRRQVKAGKVPQSVQNPRHRMVTLLILAGAAAVLCVILFTGKITYTCSESALTIEPTFFSDRSIPYEEITGITYLEACETGSRISGFGSARLLLGTFRNEEFGIYTRYSYRKPGEYVLLELDEWVMILGGRDTEETRLLYETLSAYIK